MTNPDLKALFGPIAVTTLALVVCAGPALGADSFFGTESPLLKFVDFIVGPFAYAVVIIALVITVGVLAIGGEFSGFARRMPIVVVAGGIVILAGDVISNLFGANRAADIPRRGALAPLSDGQADAEIIAAAIRSASAVVIVCGVVLVVAFLAYRRAAARPAPRTADADAKFSPDDIDADFRTVDVATADFQPVAIHLGETTFPRKGAGPE